MRRCGLRHQSAVKLWYELTLIARADPGGQPQRPADQILHLALPELVVIGNERLRAAGGFQLRLQPARIEQECIERRSFPRRRQMRGPVQEIIAARGFVRARICINPVQSLQQALMQRGQSIFPCLLLQEVPHRVVEAEGAPVEIE